MRSPLFFNGSLMNRLKGLKEIDSKQVLDSQNNRISNNSSLENINSYCGSFLTTKWFQRDLEPWAKISRTYLLVSASSSKKYKKDKIIGLNIAQVRANGSYK